MSQAFRESGIKFVDEKDRPKVARFTEVKDFGASLTSQSFGDEADINKIMARVVKRSTGSYLSGSTVFMVMSRISVVFKNQL